MLQRVFGKHHILFSIGGIAVFVYGCYLVYAKIITSTEAIPFLGGLYGLWMKNGKKEEEKFSNEINKLKDEVKEREEFIRHAGHDDLDAALEEFRAKNREGCK